MYGHPDAWHRLCGTAGRRWSATTWWRRSKPAWTRCRCSTRGWARSSAADYREFALPHTRRIFEIVGSRVPTIHFGTGTAMMLDDDARGRRRRDRRRLAHPARRGLGAHRPRPRHPGQPRSDAAARPAGRACAARWTTSSSASAAARATSSTSATASCRRRRSSTCRCSPATSTRRRDRHARLAPRMKCLIRRRRRSSAAASPGWRRPTSCSGAAARCACSTAAQRPAA